MLFSVTYADGMARKIVATDANTALSAVQMRTGRSEIACVETVNAHRISARQAMIEDGRSWEELAYDSSIPACCDEGCEVDPDGTCPHDCPSILLAKGMI